MTGRQLALSGAAVALFGALIFLVPRADSSSGNAHIIVGGDMMFDRAIRADIQAKGGDYIFSCIDPILGKADAVIANLEGPITGNASISLGSTPGDGNNYTFTFPKEIAPLLYTHNISLVNLGNNHIENFGTAGVESTIAALDGADVGHFGDPIHNNASGNTIGDANVAFVNYNEFGGSASGTLAKIQEVRQKGYIPIVYTHWGVEYATSAPASVHELAHEFIDAGAAMVIGSHPHVVEEHEMYKGKYIYYSLGNFIFDQYWEDAVTHGLLLDITLNAQGVKTVQEIPVEMLHDGRTCPVS